MDLLHEEREPIEWRSLHVGAERGANCEHRHALLTNILQRHWERQEDCRTDLEPGVLLIQHGFHGEFGRENGVRRGQALSGTGDSLHDRSSRSRGGGSCWLRCKTFKGSACFENRETEFMCSRCIRQGVVEARVLWRRVAKNVSWNAEEKWKHDVGRNEAEEGARIG